MLKNLIKSPRFTVIFGFIISEILAFVDAVLVPHKMLKGGKRLWDFPCCLSDVKKQFTQ